MPLYEGIGLISEKHAVVIDIGSVYTKCGFAGETGPRCIVPSEVFCSKTGSKQKICNYKSEEDLYSMLVDFLHYLYFKHLLVHPKDRRVVVVESLLSLTTFRESLAKVLFRRYEVSSVLFVPSHLVALFTLGVSSALVLDVGYQEAVLIPVYEGIPVLHAWQAHPLAGQALQSNLESLLLEQCSVHGCSQSEQRLSEMYTAVSESVLEDIKVRSCFVTTLPRGKQIQVAKVESAEMPLAAPGLDYPLGGGEILHIEGSIREAAAEIMFEQDKDEVSLATMVLDALLKCPIDMRRTLAENIIIIGGTAMMLGFKSRLMAEVKALLDSPKYQKILALKTFKVHRPPAKENYVAWLGAAIFGATEMVSIRSLTREQYLQQNTVPDWANLRYNCKDDEKTM